MGDITQHFDYDANGNRTGRLIGVLAEPYTYGPASNRLEEVGTTSQTHDAAGNTTGDGTYTYNYNTAGRLTEVRAGGTWVATYTYNAQGQRTRKVRAAGETA